MCLTPSVAGNRAVKVDSASKSAAKGGSVTHIELPLAETELAALDHLAVRAVLIAGKIKS